MRADAPPRPFRIVDTQGAAKACVLVPQSSAAAMMSFFMCVVLDNRASGVLLFSANRLLVRANDGHAVLSFCEAPRHQSGQPEPPLPRFAPS